MWILPKQLHTLAFVPDMVGLSLDSSESSRLCAQSLFVRSKPSPARTWLQKWKRDSWTQHLFGRILKPSHGKSFVTAWTSSLAVIPASPSVTPESASEPTTPDIFGPTSQAELGLCAHESASLKMSKGTLVLDSEKSLANWNKWVMKRRGEYLARLNAVRLIKENECLSWPTASTRDHKGGYEGGQIRDGKISMDALDVAVQAYTDGGLAAPDNPSAHGSRPESWATPRAQEPTGDTNFVHRNADRGEHCHPSLTSQAKAWATPRASKTTDENPETWALRQAKGDVATMPLGAQVQAWATPRTKDADGWMMNQARLAAGKPEDTLTGQALNSNKNNGKLNPRWVETLMGLPVGWTMPSCTQPVTIAQTSCASSATE